MTSHTKTYTNGYLFERLKTVRLLLVMRSRSIGMPFERLGLSVQKNIQAFGQLLLSVRKKNSSVRTAEVSIQNSKLFSLSNSRGFPYAKGNPIRFSFSRRFRFPQPAVPHFCHRTPLFVGVHFKGIALQMSR